MQAITFPSGVSAESVPVTLLDAAWTLLNSQQLTLDAG